LATYIPAGKLVSLAPAVLASLEQAFPRAEDFASYEALRQWVRQTHGVEVKYKTRYTLVRTRFHVKLKVARPSHKKTPAAIPVFQATCRAQLQQAIPAANTRPSGCLARTKAVSAC